MFRTASEAALHVRMGKEPLEGITIYGILQIAVTLLCSTVHLS